MMKLAWQCAMSSKVAVMWLSKPFLATPKHFLVPQIIQLKIQKNTDCILVTGRVSKIKKKHYNMAHLNVQFPF
jgi:hypothetical protein